MSISHSALLVSVPTISQLHSPEYLSDAITTAVTHTQKSLLIIVFSHLFSTPGSPEAHSKDVPILSHNPAQHWEDIQRLLTFIYVEASRKAQELDNILLSVDVVLRGSGAHDITPDVLKAYQHDGWEKIFIHDGDDEIPLDDLSISHLPTTIFHPKLVAKPAALLNEQATSLVTEVASHVAHPISAIRKSTDSGKEPDSASRFPVVALGGTFDHLHAGHKILLSVAAWLASTKVIVGVTDESLLTKKSNRDVLESIDTRIASVRAFCTRFNASLEYDIVPINDVYGPTAWDLNIQALVLSYETREGAAAIAKLRDEKNLSALTPFVIDVISSNSTRIDPDDAVALKQGKMSSTAIREWIAKREKKEESS